jgi:hypothetical protein
MKIIIFAAFVALALSAATDFTATATAATAADADAWCVASIGASHTAVTVGTHKASLNLAGYTAPVAETTEAAATTRLL